MTDTLTTEQNAKLEVLILKAETGEQWAEICRLEDEMLRKINVIVTDPADEYDRGDVDADAYEACSEVRKLLSSSFFLTISRDYFNDLPLVWSGVPGEPGDPAASDKALISSLTRQPLAAKAAFTPGPWAIDPDDRPDMEWNNHIVRANKPEERICFMANGLPDRGDEFEANANLIAAAPTLHDAVKAAHRWIGGMSFTPNCNDEAERLIAILEGALVEAGTR